MPREASLKQITDMLDRVGWDKGIAYLEKETAMWENMQANLYADPETIRKAAKLGPKIVQQQITIIRLKQIQKERNK